MDEHFYPDILERAGRQPREFGTVHLHVEPVLRAAEGTQATARIWLQGAFEPMTPAATLRVIDAETREELLCVPLPAMERGRVLRWTLPLTLAASARALLFQPEAPVPEHAQRVRPPWRLFDTLEMTSEARLAASPSADLVRLGSTIAFGSLATQVLLGPRQPHLVEELRLKRHAAHALPDGFVAEIIEGAPPSVEAPVSEVVWEPGQKFDPTRWQETSSPGSRQVRCECGATVPRDAEFCPQCLGSLAGAVPAESVVEAPMAFAPVAFEPAPPATPEEDLGPRCPRHPQVEETRTCPRCGAFYCALCLPDALEAERTVCPACVERDTEKDPVQLRRALMRDMAKLHGGLTAFMLVTVLISVVSNLGDAKQMLDVGIGGAIIVLVYGGLSGLLALVRRPILGWGLFVIDALFGMLMLSSRDFIDGTAILAVAAISFLQLLRAGSLAKSG
ncbi:hypothetical protein DRW03_19355 [Corallococcus sp. H22C18031201]|nr:hypothetical protein DRW03_19355 [Corallococcus sp. H22C18031201]